MALKYAVGFAALGVAALMTGCTSSDSVVTTDASPARQSTSNAAPAEDGQYTVDSLGVTFRLPDSFRAVDNPDYLFLGESTTPRSLFTILGESPSVTDHTAEPGETLTRRDLGEGEAVVVANAVLDGMPADISSNELLVSDGERSFSVIMSADPTSLPAMWQTFIDSLTVIPQH